MTQSICSTNKTRCSTKYKKYYKRRYVQYIYYIIIV